MYVPTIACIGALKILWALRYPLVVSTKYLITIPTTAIFTYCYAYIDICSPIPRTYKIDSVNKQRIGTMIKK